MVQRALRVAAAAAALAVGVSGCGRDRLTRVVSALEVSEVELDYGMVALGAQGQRELRLLNASRAPVRVYRLDVAAPFAVAGLPEEGLVLQAAEERRLQVNFAPVGEGRFEAQLAIDSDAELAPVAVFLRGEAVKVELGTGGPELQFGQVMLGGERTLELVLTNASPLDAQVELSLDGLDLDAFTAGGSTFTVPANGSFRMPVTFHPSHLGMAEARVTLSICPTCPATTVLLSGEGTASCIAANPGTLDFGNVDVGSSALRTFEVRNEGKTPAQLTEAFLASSSSKDFHLEGFTPGSAVSLAPGASAQLRVRFTPSGDGEHAGAVRARAGTGSDNCWAEVRLRANGGSGCLQVEPLAVDFGLVASGMSSKRPLVLANVACGSDVWVEGLDLSGDPAFTAGASRPPPFRLAQGETIVVNVAFSPSLPGSYGGSLRVLATDDQHRPLAKPPPDVPLTGSARALAPCQYEVVPPRLDFGAVSVGQSASLAFKVRNLGVDDCFFSGVGLTPSSAPEFRLSGANPGFVLRAAHYYDLRVVFTPKATGQYAGAMELYVSDPANPYASFPISAQAVSGCLSVRPQLLDFGKVFVACPPPSLVTEVRNGCPGPVELLSLVRGAGTSNEFSLPGAPSFPVTLAQGDSLELEVRYAPTDKGADSLPLYLDDGTARHLIAARGSGVVDPKQVDPFDIPLQNKVDVLFVLDNSGSMADKQAAVGANLAAFLRNALAQNVDYHIAVTTTGLEPSTGGWTSCPGGADGGESGRLFPVDGSSPRIITRATRTPEAVFGYNTAVGVCHWLEQGLEAASRALSSPLIDQADDPRTVLPADGNLGLLRPEAKLAVVFVSDEDDQSSGTVDSYLNFLRSLKPDPSLVSISVIVSPADLSTCPQATTPGLRYIELARKAGGTIESICTPDWAASLERLGNDAFGGQTLFPLSDVPEDPAKIVVTVNGVIIPAAGNWTYDAAANAVRFEPSKAPAAGSHVEISYPLGCR